MCSLPEHFWTVSPHWKPDVEYGPFETLEAAREFATIRCLMQASLHEYRDVRLVEQREMTREEYEEYHAKSEWNLVDLGSHDARL